MPLLKATATILMAFWLTLVVLYARDGEAKSPASLPFAIMGLIASVAIIVLSFMEHEKSVKPSLLLNTFLLISLFFDVAHCRTLFLLEGHTRIAAIYAATLALKVVLLFLEARNKRSHLKIPYMGLATESTVGIFNLSFFWWLNETFVRGFRELLSPGDLQQIDTDLTSEKLGERLQRAWDERSE